MRLPVAVAFTLAFPLVAGCANPFTSDDIAGTYTLQMEDGKSLPRLLSATIECDLFLTGGVLTMTENESFILDLHEQIDCSRAGGPVQDAGHSYMGTFALHGRNITFTSPRFGQSPITFEGAENHGIVAVTIVDPDVSAWGQLKPVFQHSSRTTTLEP
jgi:hypothetical protein